MDILEVLTSQLGGDALGQISRQLGTDEKTAGNATDGRGQARHMRH